MQKAMFIMFKIQHVLDTVSTLRSVFLSPLQFWSKSMQLVDLTYGDLIKWCKGK